MVPQHDISRLGDVFLRTIARKITRDVLLCAVYGLDRSARQPTTLSNMCLALLIAVFYALGVCNETAMYAAELLEAFNARPGVYSFNYRSPRFGDVSSARYECTWLMVIQRTMTNGR